MSLFAIIIISVKYQRELLSAKFLPHLRSFIHKSSLAASARWLPRTLKVAGQFLAEAALINAMHEALRVYCPRGWGVRPVNSIYRL